MATVAGELKRLREAASLTLTQVAAAVGTTPASIASVERADHLPNVTLLFRLCVVYGVSPEHWATFFVPDPTEIVIPPKRRPGRPQRER